jgi:acetyl/propionyl-CoA carboxylase alpha subunit
MHTSHTDVSKLQRLLRAVHELGGEAVVVYSTDDTDQLHVALAAPDHAIRLSGTSPLFSWK